jgi:hypothetical protein
MPTRNSSAISSKGAGILAIAIALPLAVIRKVMRVPTALVDMMEQHGIEK